MLYDHTGRIIIDSTRDANAIVVRDATRPPQRSTSIDAREIATTQSIDANDKIESLLRELSIAKIAKNIDECKSIRRALRKLNHFGGARERSSRYYDRTRDAYDVDALIERQRRNV